MSEAEEKGSDAWKRRGEEWEAQAYKIADELYEVMKEAKEGR